MEALAVGREAGARQDSVTSDQESEDFKTESESESSSEDERDQIAPMNIPGGGGDNAAARNNRREGGSSLGNLRNFRFVRDGKTLRRRRVDEIEMV